MGITCGKTVRRFVCHAKIHVTNTPFDRLSHSPFNLVANPHRGGFVDNRGRGMPTLGQAIGSSSGSRGYVPEEFQTCGDFNVWNHRGRGGSRGPGLRGGAGRGNLLGRGFKGSIQPTRGSVPRGRGGG